MMSKKETEMQIEINRRKYLTPGTISLMRPKNAMFLSAANSIKHELAKTIGALMLQRYGDLDFSLKLKKLIWEVQKEIQESMKNFPKSNEPYISEAVPTGNKNRRIDLVRLRDMQHFEFETDHNLVKKEGAFTVYI